MPAGALPGYGRMGGMPTIDLRAARLFTEVFAPALLAATLPVVIGLHAGPTLLAGLAWGLLASLFCAVVPYGMILLGVRRGTLSDRHIGVRSQRTRPLTLGLLSVLAGLTLLLVLGAPRELVALVVASFAGGAVGTAINHFWKMSVHASVAAGSAVVLVLVFGPPLLAAWLVVAAVGWSRVRLRDHTTAQVLTGTVIGAAIAGVVFGLLR
jgi:membrane-associated phospholipid phosphatase